MGDLVKDLEAVRFSVPVVDPALFEDLGEAVEAPQTFGEVVLEVRVVNPHLSLGVGQRRLQQTKCQVRLAVNIEMTGSRAHIDKVFLNVLHFLVFRKCLEDMERCNTDSKQEERKETNYQKTLELIKLSGVNQTDMNQKHAYNMYTYCYFVINV